MARKGKQIRSSECQECGMKECVCTIEDILPKKKKLSYIDREKLNHSLEISICEELGIDPPEAPLTLLAIRILHKLKSDGACYVQLDDDDHEATIQVLREVGRNWGYQFDVDVDGQLTVVDFNRFEIQQR